jgi:hypothetical protein
MTYRDAFAHAMGSSPLKPPLLPLGGMVSEPAHAFRASPTWGIAATDFVRNSLDYMSTKWKEVLLDRHLTPETARRFGIGWNQTDIYIPCEAWGIEGNKLRIPAGLVIPTHRKSGIVAIKVRCHERVSNPKYWQIRGGGDESLILGSPDLPVIIVESELDAYLIWQEGRKAVSVVALGGTNKRLDKNARIFVEGAPRILVATDFDESKDLDQPGAGQSAYFDLKQQFPSAEYLPPAVGTDPCEMQTQGVRVRDWIACALLKDEVDTRPLVPGSYRGSGADLVKCLIKYSELIPCPKTNPMWLWKYRRNCGSCAGHIHCVRNLPLAPKNITP